MNIRENISLAPFHTFGIDVKTRYLAEFVMEEEVAPFLLSGRGEHPFLILGEGSNTLFTTDFPGTIIRLNTRGIDVVKESSDYVVIKVSAGEKWDDVVQYCVEKGWGGIENLSLIPGQTGAAPIQNIGAYGTELKDVMVELEAIQMEGGEKKMFQRDQCEFGYRESIFRTTLRGRFLILNVTLRLHKEPVVNTAYGSIRKELQNRGVQNPTIKEIRDVVCDIRRKKLPDPSVTGNAGSFFKNPVIRKDQFEKLKRQYPDIVNAPDSNGVKLAAAWLIEQCDWKGKRSGDAGVHKNHPLVLVNYGKATGQQILDLASMIRQSVLTRFGILLEPEVNIL